MPETSLVELLEQNDNHTSSLPKDYFDAVQSGQQPATVSVCCSDSRVSQEGMWNVTEPGWLFTPSTIGNQVWDEVDGDAVVDGSVGYPLAHTGTTIVAIVGHTGCGAITAALQTVQEGVDAEPAGVEKWVKMLVPVVEAGLDSEAIRSDREVSLLNQLVEYNVDRQVEFLLDSDECTEEVDVYGFVYDFQYVYGDVPGRVYLTNANGETDLSRLYDLVPDHVREHVQRLLV